MTIIGTIFGCFYNPLKDISLYMKHKRRHIIELDTNFEMLGSKYRSLLASKEHIVNELTFHTRNDQYSELEQRIKSITKRYTEIESKFKKSGLADDKKSGLADDKKSGGLEHLTDRGEGSTSSAQVAPNQQRKIWTTKFFSNARLDKDVLKLIKDIDEVKIGDVKLETLVTNCRVQWLKAPEKDRMPQWHYVEKLLEYLEDASTKRIGIYGHAQVGKSTILRKLNNCFHPNSTPPISLKYVIVIWVNFPSKDSGDIMENMRKQILESIGGFDKQSSGHNAAKINEKLANVKYLLILDDVYKEIDLEDLGIHDHKYGQIVIGATGIGVLNCMNVDKKILIKKLKDDVAEKFFKEYLGLESNTDLSLVQPYMKRTIELIDGHIGALVRIADSIKGLGTNNTDSNVWKAVVCELQLPNSFNMLGLGALEKAYQVPYDELKDKNLKKCFLYVALFPFGYHAHKSYLVECWKAEDFLQDYHTFKEARDIGYIICHKLTETHLLEWSGKEHLTMPLLCRKVALQIPYPDETGDNKLLVRSISEICAHPSERDWDINKRISLMCGKLHSEYLPNHPKCNNTSTLLLQGNLELKVIGNQFFINMGNLRVLDLQRTGIDGLPESISKLENLKCLYLNDCSLLNSLPTEMKKLNQLELLDIRRILMRCLPCEIWCLKTLRCLRISVYGLEGNSSEIVMPSQQPCFSREFLKLEFLEELTVHVDPQTPGIVDQIKEVLKEAEHNDSLKVIWEAEESYLHNSNNVIANGSGLNVPIALTGSHSNGQDITEPTTINKQKHVNQLKNTEASTSTTNRQPTGSTKDWVQKSFHDN